MGSFELTTGEELIRQHAPELIPHLDPEMRIAVQFGTLSLSAMLTFWMVQLTHLGVGPLFTLGLTSAVAVSATILADRKLRRSHQRNVVQFFEDLKNSPWTFYEAVAANFASEIERQRARTLGPDSEWGRARRPLESASQETDRSVAYWKQR